MKVLGIDTSTHCGSVGLMDEGKVLSEILLNVPVTHSERLIGAIDHVLAETRCRIEDLDGWAISLGPGSFTGLRIGASTVKGLAFATQKPVAGIPTLDVLAFQVSLTPFLICSMLDARKEEVYTAFYRYGEDGLLRRESPYRAVAPEALVAEIAEKTVFVGDGCVSYRRAIEKALSSKAFFVFPPLNVPRGSTVAHLGFERLSRGEALDLATFAPMYVRPSEAEIKWAERESSVIVTDFPIIDKHR